MAYLRLFRLLFGFVLAGAATHGASAQPICLAIDQIQSAIASGEIRSWPKAKNMAGIDGYEEVSSVKVCLVDGVPHFTVNVVSPDGRASKIIISAVDGRRAR